MLLCIQYACKIASLAEHCTCHKRYFKPQTIPFDIIMGVLVKTFYRISRGDDECGVGQNCNYCKDFGKTDQNNFAIKRYVPS